VEIKIMKNPWLLGVRTNQLYISFKKRSKHDKVFIAVVNPEKWMVAIKNNMTLMLAERCVNNGTDKEPTSDA